MRRSRGLGRRRGSRRRRWNACEASFLVALRLPHLRYGNGRRRGFTIVVAPSFANRERGAMSGIQRDFKDFILRGNLITLAIAFVMGTAFAALLTAFVTFLVTPFI